MANTIFWNVDTQYDFMCDDESFRGALAIPGARVIEPNLERLTALAAERELRVVNTADWHTRSSPEISETPDFLGTYPLHCEQGTRGAEYVPATLPENPLVISWADAVIDYQRFQAGIKKHRNIVLYKDEFDIFHPRGGPHTDKVLEILQPDRAIVYGVATNVCVDFAVRGLRKRGVEVYVPTDAIKELPHLPLSETLERWRTEGVHLFTTADVAIEI